MGELITATIYVDTSFNDGTSQSGYYIHLKHRSKPFINYTRIFKAPDNNTAEIMGIQKACMRAIKLYYEKNERQKDDKFHFTVYNDNITAVAVSDSCYKPSPKANGRFINPCKIKQWCEKNNVTLKCIRKKRSDPLMKICDKLSRVYKEK